jgi:putative protease
LEAAISRPLDRATLEKQLSRLGDTGFSLGMIDARIDGEVLAPLGLLNRLRRELAAEVERRLRPAKTSRKPAAKALRELLPDPVPPPSGEPPRLSALVRSMEQLDAALEAGADEIIVDFEDIRRARGAVERFRENSGGSGSPRRIFLATPRIHKPRESGHFRVLETARPDGLLLRNLGALAFFRNHPDFILHADFTLNVANPLSARLLREAAGLERLTVSYDLDVSQVLDLLKSAPPDWFELTLHQHMPMFHMEHCVFCAFLSEGTDYRNCGHPCEKHRVHLRDRIGMLHILQADIGCRNTLFRGQAQTGAPFFPELLASGLRRFRVELLQENRSESLRTLRLYQDLLAARTDPASVWRTLKADTRLGVTKGTFAGK